MSTRSTAPPDAVDRAAEAAVELLRERGPLSTDDVIGLLVAAGHPTEDVAEAVDNIGGYGGLHLGDVVVHGAAVREGAVFTHRLTEIEAAHGFIADDADLDVLVCDLAGDEAHPLAAGGGLQLTGSTRSPGLAIDGNGTAIVGPPGWLARFDPGDLLAFRVRDGAIEIAVATPVEHRELASWLREAYERQKMQDATAFVMHVVLDVLVHHPDAFAAPRLPLGELIASAGLSREDDSVAPGGFDWAALWERRRAQSGQRYADESGLDEIDGRLLHDLAVANILLVGKQSADGLDPDVLERARVALSSPAATEAFMDRPVVGDREDDQVAAARLLAEAALARDPAHPPAGAWWLLGRCAEFDNDVEAHRHALAAALRIDPAFAPALADLAMYASDAGDAGRALGLLARAGEDDPLLEYYAAPGSMRAGRNQPCPCESGRKHKACCGPRNGHPLDDRCEWLLDKLRQFALRPPQEVWLRPAAEAVGAAGDDADEVGLRTAIAMHQPALVDLVLFEDGVVEQFLDARGALLPSDEYELLEDWTAEHHRVARVRAVSSDALEVEDVETGAVAEIIGAVSSGPHPAPGDHVLVLELPDGRGGSFGSLHPLDAGVGDAVNDALADGWGIEQLAPLVVGPAVDRALARLRHPRPASEERLARLAWLFPDATGLDDPDDDDRIGELVEADHPFTLLDDDEAEERHRLHLAMHQIVVRQVLDDTPPEAWLTAQRLHALGIERHELHHMLASAVAPDVFAALEGTEPAGDDAYAARLAALPGTWAHGHPGPRRRGRHRR